MTREHPFWGYEDLALFLSAVLPSFALAALAVRTARLSSDAMKTLMFQSLVYALLLGSLYLLISVRYGQPFWRALGWKTAYPGGWLCVVAGPVLAVGVAGLGSVLRAPVVPTPIENLVSDRRSLVIMLFWPCAARCSRNWCFAASCSRCCPGLSEPGPELCSQRSRSRCCTARNINGRGSTWCWLAWQAWRSDMLDTRRSRRRPPRLCIPVIT